MLLSPPSNIQTVSIEAPVIPFIAVVTIGWNGSSGNFAYYGWSGDLGYGSVDPATPSVDGKTIFTIANGHESGVPFRWTFFIQFEDQDAAEAALTYLQSNYTSLFIEGTGDAGDVTLAFADAQVRTDGGGSGSPEETNCILWVSSDGNLNSLWDAVGDTGKLWLIA